MVRWSSFFKFPFEHVEYGNHLLGTKIGSDIFVITTDNSPPNSYIFNTDTEEYRKVDCSFEEVPIRNYIEWIGSYGNTIYMWMPGNIMDRVATLYKANIKSLKFKKILTMARNDVQFDNSVVLGNKMYVMDINSVRSKLLIIDLLTNKTSTMKLDSDAYDGIVSTKDEQLFLFTRSFTSCTVSLIDNGKVMKISDESFEMKDVQEHHWPRVAIFYETHHYENFNHKSGKWEKMQIEPTALWGLSDYWNINGNVYTMRHTNSGSDSGIKVLELNPKLSTICIFNLIDEILAENVEDKRDQLRQKTIDGLPFNKRAKLVSMLDWRIQEKEDSEASDEESDEQSEEMSEVESDDEQ